MSEGVWDKGVAAKVKEKILHETSNFVWFGGGGTYHRTRGKARGAPVRCLGDRDRPNFHAFGFCHCGTGINIYNKVTVVVSLVCMIMSSAV